MPKRYHRINWRDAPSTATPRNARNFNILDKGIDDLDNAIEDVQGQINNLVVEGDSSVEAAQARNTYPTLKARLDTENETVMSQLRQIDTQKANKDEIINGLTAKDGVKTWAQLSAMTTGNKIGDYYYCSDGDGTNPAGNYRWTGSGWSFGGTGDQGYSMLRNDLVDLYKQITIIATKEQTIIKSFEFIAGRTYLIKNTSSRLSNAANIWTYNGSANIETLVSGLVAGAIIRVTPTQSAEYVKIYCTVEGSFTIIDEESIIRSEQQKINKILLDTLRLEQGGIVTSNGLNNDTSARVRTNEYLSGSFDIEVPYGFIIKAVCYYNMVTLAFDSAVEPNYYQHHVGKDNCVARISFAKKDGTNISVTDLQLVDKSNISYTIATSADTYYIPYKFIEGETYRIYNTGTIASQINAWTNNVKDTSSRVQCVVRGLNGGFSADFKASFDANFLRFYATTALTVKIKHISQNEKYPPQVKFYTDTTLRDVSTELSRVDFSVNGQKTMLEQIHSLFDELVTEHSDYVTKQDAATYAALTYPSYANGVGNVPAYRTYMYRFNASDQTLGESTSAKKKRLLILASVHGNEIASAFNSYLLARNLCKNYLQDDNWYKMRSCFDIYIIPCVNGYGMYSLSRANYNKVNINRNFPVKNWMVSGEETKNSGLSQYTGATAGSEFETQLVMGVTKKIEPDMAIDLHNYSKQDFQFYTILPRYEMLHLANEAAIDCVIAFKKGLPQYFGNAFGGIKTNNEEAPARVTSNTIGNTVVWWHEFGIPVCATPEISQGINYLNGSYSNELQNSFGTDAFSVAEFTLRNQLLRYAQYLMDTN